MKISGILKSMRHYLTNFVQSQLIVTLVSIPILVGWGLQISMMTFIGNLIFAPILTIFLILSSIVFFTELLGIPNLFIVKTLEFVTIFWDIILSLGKKEWLCGFCKPSTFFLFLIPIIAFLMLLFIKAKNSKIKFLSLLGFCCISIFCLNIVPKLFNNQPQSSTFYDGKLTINFDTDKNITLIDNGFFNTKSSPEKTINYELKQYLIKTIGKTELQNVILCKPGYRTFRAAQALCSKLDVKTITLPSFEKKLSKSAQCEFFKLKDLLQKNGITFACQN
ncbi:MAG: hypothetical protein WCS92_05940 [Candidatus Babeliales bacterium]|nr:MAG: hypothetical protein US22_C0003G0005 [candidate division TM6 bacterium GW2011_GWF2_36_6]